MIHRIEIRERGERLYWECNCGRGGSVGEFADVELAAERHLEIDDQRSFRWV